MKKLFFLFALLGLIAFPMFASEITFGGDVTYGVISDFNDNEADTSTLTYDIKATIDDFNSLSAELDIKSPALKKAVVTTDIGAFFELPVGLKLDWGYLEPNCNKFQGVSERGNEKVFDLKGDKYWGFNLLATIEMVEIELAFDPGEAVGSGGENGRLLAGLAIKEPIEGLNAEVYYFQSGAKGLTGDAEVAMDVMDEGVIAFDVGYGMDVNDDLSFKVGAGLGYLLAEVADGAVNLEYGFGVKASYSIATLTAGLDGDNVDALGGVTATLEVAPIDLVSIYAGLEMDMTEAASTAETTFQGADAGICLKLGAAKVYLGYLVTEVEGGKWRAPAALAEGGAYIKCDIDY